MKVVLLAILFAAVFAQIHEDIAPLSSSLREKRVLFTPTITLARPDVDKFMSRPENAADKESIIGVPIPVGVSLAKMGFWTQVSASHRVWRLRFVVPGATHTNLIFNKIKLAASATLHIIGKDASNYLGAFTSKNNQPKEWGTVPLEGDEFTLELVESSSTAKTSELELSHVVYGIKNLFGQSGKCNLNAVCADLKFINQSRSAGMLMTSTGSRFCSGSMLNNVQQNGRQILLTAYHCRASSSSVIVFNYQSQECKKVVGESLKMSAAGFKSLAEDRDGDFAMFEVVERIPEEYNVFLNGFDAERKSFDTNFAYCFHHPKGDVKKFSISTLPLAMTKYLGKEPGDVYNHWRVDYWTSGTTEPGSSGSPLFSHHDRVIGQLHGGYASCSRPKDSDWYGAVVKNWDHSENPKTNMKATLDPENTGTRVMDGAYLNNLRTPL